MGGMLSLDPYLVLLLVGCLYALVFGFLGYTRREGLSTQFLLEVVVLTLVLTGVSWLLHNPLNPVLFLAILYVVTMRSRLAVDLANILARRERYDLAFRLYRLALAWWPDAASKLIVQTNLGAAQLYGGQVDTAIDTLSAVMEAEKRPRLGIKYEAACHYNLGFAYEKKGEKAEAMRQYNEALDALPGSVYAQAAQKGINRLREKE
jgi:tetratricopeptide (TPR) repeat protein